jgi:hypothetical protein
MNALRRRAKPVDARLRREVRSSGSPGRCLRAVDPARLLPVCALLLSLAIPAAPTMALEEQAGEKQAIDACDKHLCTIVQGKEAAGEDLKCALTKTWARSTLKEADQREVQWMFGDARCSVKLEISRAKIVGALTGGEVKFWVPPHTANCIVEQDGRLEKLMATVAPKIVFRDGKASKIWINLRNVEGPAGIKATLQTAAQLNDSLGLFHRAMLKSVNRYIYKHCPKYHPLTQAAATAPMKPKPAAAKPSQSAAPRKDGG